MYLVQICRFNLSSNLFFRTAANSIELDIDSYGRWCGPNHGGFSDCCNGRPCPQCNSYPPSSACLQACPPIDALDSACASHDSCWAKTPSYRCRLGTTHSCNCNCDLVTKAATSSICDRAPVRDRCRIYARAVRAVFCNYRCYQNSCRLRLDPVCPACD